MKRLSPSDLHRIKTNQDTYYGLNPYDGCFLSEKGDPDKVANVTTSLTELNFFLEVLLSNKNSRPWGLILWISIKCKTTRRPFYECYLEDLAKATGYKGEKSIHKVINKLKIKNLLKFAKTETGKYVFQLVQPNHVWANGQFFENTEKLLHFHGDHVRQKRVDNSRNHVDNLKKFEDNSHNDGDKSPPPVSTVDTETTDKVSAVDTLGIHSGYQSNPQLHVTPKENGNQNLLVSSSLSPSLSLSLISRRGDDEKNMNLFLKKEMTEEEMNREKARQLKEFHEMEARALLKQG